MDALEQRAFDFFKTLSDFKMRKQLEDLEEDLKEKKSDLKEATNIFTAYSTRPPVVLKEINFQLGQAIPKGMKQVAKASTDCKNEIMQDAQQAYAKAEAYYNELKAYYDSLSDQISKIDLKDEISSVVEDAQQELTSLVKDTIKDAKQEFMDYLNELRDNLTQMWQDVLDFIDKLKNGDFDFNLSQYTDVWDDDDNEFDDEDEEEDEEEEEEENIETIIFDDPLVITAGGSEKKKKDKKAKKEKTSAPAVDNSAGSDSISDGGQCIDSNYDPNFTPGYCVDPGVTSPDTPDSPGTPDSPDTPDPQQIPYVIYDPSVNIGKPGQGDNIVKNDGQSDDSDFIKDQIEDFIKKSIIDFIAFKGLTKVAGDWLYDQLKSYTEELAKLHLLGNAKEKLTDKFQELIGSERFEQIVETTSGWKDKTAGVYTDVITKTYDFVGDKITQGTGALGGILPDPIGTKLSDVGQMVGDNVKIYGKTQAKMGSSVIQGEVKDVFTGVMEGAAQSAIGTGNVLSEVLPDPAASFIINTSGKTAETIMKASDIGGDLIDMIF